MLLQEGCGEEKGLSPPRHLFVPLGPPHTSKQWGCHQCFLKIVVINI
jgi:hypothetical protein